jgi:hypothetical protein
LREVPGLGVSVISACIGESARKNNIMLMIKTGSPIEASYPSKPWMRISLDGLAEYQDGFDEI